MGIKHFWKFFREKFSDGIIPIPKGETIQDTEIDILMVDMNGIFHNSAQKIYQYGEYKPLPRVMGGYKYPKPKNTLQTQIKTFEDVCLTLEKLLQVVKPKKKLILCVDGPAPLSKQSQQRQRRFLSSLESDENSTFDSCSITPGTKFMDFLTKYIDWYIRKQISDSDSAWSKLEVIFSNEKSPGEGEHKLLNFVRKYGQQEETFCITGMDADLIMLALVSHMPKFYILRDEMMNPEISYNLVDISVIRTCLKEVMFWEEGHDFDTETAINDFVLMCFTVGNDFLPHIPGLEIIEGSIDFMFDVYKKIGKKYGHLTKFSKKSDSVVFHRKSLSKFFEQISDNEKRVFEQKLGHKRRYFPNPMLENCSEMYRDQNGLEKYCVDVEGYRTEYYKQNFPEISEEKICQDYLEGLQWVLTYYTQGPSNWTWFYPHHYAPFSFSLAKYVKKSKNIEYPVTKPTIPFIQLLSVLPPKSSKLLPSPLDELLHGKEMEKHCPEEFEIDTAGCRHRWEGKVLLPFINYEHIQKLYQKYSHKIAGEDMKRNLLGKTYRYAKNSSEYMFKSFYGNFPCSVVANVIDL